MWTRRQVMNLALIVFFCWIVALGFASAVIYFAKSANAAEGYGPMVVEWHMMETKAEISKHCQFHIEVLGCHYKRHDGTHVILTLIPRGTTDTETWYTVMHELGHVKLGCYHDRYGQYIGPMHDPEVCKERRLRP